MDEYEIEFVSRLYRKATFNEKGCWLINQSLTVAGYHYTSYRGKHVRGHRKIYEIVNGAIPEGLVMDHLCRNRNCCNPDHLEAVTVGENSRRGIAYDVLRNKTHCTHGHEYTLENTIRLKKTGHRQCRVCRKITDKKRRPARHTRAYLEKYCSNGHERIDQNTYIQPDGKPRCRICGKNNNKKLVEKGYFLNWQRNNPDKMKLYHLRWVAKRNFNIII